MDDPGLFSALSTAYLRQARDALRHPIPGDPTFFATLAALLRPLVDRELADPARAERDKAEAAEHARIAAERADPEFHRKAAEEADRLRVAASEERARKIDQGEPIGSTGAAGNMLGTKPQPIGEVGATAG